MTIDFGMLLAISALLTGTLCLQICWRMVRQEVRQHHRRLAWLRAQDTPNYRQKPGRR
jgi:hypothetical protein